MDKRTSTRRSTYKETMIGAKKQDRRFESEHRRPPISPLNRQCSLNVEKQESVVNGENWQLPMLVPASQFYSISDRLRIDFGFVFDPG